MAWVPVVWEFLSVCPVQSRLTRYSTPCYFAVVTVLCIGPWRLIPTRSGEVDFSVWCGGVEGLVVCSTWCSYGGKA